MGTHTAEKNRKSWTHCGGYAIQTTSYGARLRNTFWSIPWPVLAQKLDSQSKLEKLELSDGSVTMESNLPEDILRNLLLGHRRDRKWNSWWISAALVPVIGIFACVPLSEPRAQAKPVIVAKAIDPCNLATIEDWLLGSRNSGEPQLGRSVSLGGVTVGTVECRNAKYSYTLELKEPKRVLNLKKLDS